MPPAKPTNDYFQTHVLKELERLNGWLEELAKTQMRMREDIVRLKVQSSVWGFAAGCIPVLIALAIKVLTG